VLSVSSTLQRILTIINENDDTPGKGLLEELGGTHAPARNHLEH
jgi:hypothetical protein